MDMWWILKGAEHQNICRKLVDVDLKGAEHRNIILYECR